jgi:hypothetical protein
MTISTYVTEKITVLWDIGHGYGFFRMKNPIPRMG